VLRSYRLFSTRDDLAAARFSDAAETLVAASAEVVDRGPKLPRLAKLPHRSSTMPA